jgi:hypothetical protein
VLPPKVVLVWMLTIAGETRSARSAKLAGAPAGAPTSASPDLSCQKGSGAFSSLLLLLLLLAAAEEVDRLRVPGPELDARVEDSQRQQGDRRRRGE